MIPTADQSDRAARLFQKELDGIVDADTIGSIQRNEVKRDYSSWDSFEDFVYRNWPLGYPEFVEKRLSIGPAQMQLQQIEELRAKYAEQLKDVDPQSPGGAQKFIAAYMAREKERFDSNLYAAGASNGPRDGESEATQKRFEKLQDRYNQAKTCRDTDQMRRVLIESYNAGGGSQQVANVESESNRRAA